MLTDRCDRCGATAQVEAIMLAGDLRLCRYHYRLHMEALHLVAIVRSLEGLTI